MSVLTVAAASDIPYKVQNMSNSQLLLCLAVASLIMLAAYLLLLPKHGLMGCGRPGKYDQRWRNRLRIARIRMGISGRQLGEVDALAHGRTISPPDPK